MLFTASGFGSSGCVPQSISCPYRNSTSLKSQCITFDTKLGAGSSTTVFAATRIEDNTKYAVKVVEKTVLRTERHRRLLATEIDVMRSVQHPRVVRLHDVIETPERTYLVMDLMETDLQSVITKYTCLPELHTATIMRQLLCAVDYLHERHIVHRDIKLENVLVNDVDNVKLCDFGLAKVIEGTDTSSFCGSGSYMAPEIVRCCGVESPASRRAQRSMFETTPEGLKGADMWSVGVLCYAMLCGRYPFPVDVSVPQSRFAFLADVERKGVRFGVDDDVTDVAKDFIRKLLAVNSDERLTASQALQHPFVRQGESCNAEDQKITLNSLPIATTKRSSSPHDTTDDAVSSVPLSSFGNTFPIPSGCGKLEKRAEFAQYLAMANFL